MILLNLISCMDGTAEMMADWDTLVADIGTLVDDHGAAVTAATSLEDAGALEETYMADWGAMMDEMNKHMDMMGDCTMDDADVALMDEADAGMTAMDTAIAEHVAAHETHADIADCAPEEESHGMMMDTDLSTMAGYSAEWGDSMKCMSDGGGM